MTYIHQISTANPGPALSQSHIAAFLAKAMQLSEKQARALRLVFEKSGIASRHSALPDYRSQNRADWTFYPSDWKQDEMPSTAKRMGVFQEQAKPLALNAVKPLLQNHPAESFTHLITVSCTGMFAPGLDVQLIKELGLQADIERTNINFMGCFPSFNGLKAADYICRAEPEAKVLVLCLELCSIHFQNAMDKDNLLATTLFGDGAAAVVLSSQASEGALSLKGFRSILDGDSEEEMAWAIGDFGFEMKLSSYVPKVIEQGISKLTEKLLCHYDLALDQVRHFAIHPGGVRILESIEKALGLAKEKNALAYEVLRTKGNMSSPTVLFVLAEAMSVIKKGENMLSFAFGPGLTLESMLIEAH